MPMEHPFEDRLRAIESQGFYTDPMAGGSAPVSPASIQQPQQSPRQTSDFFSARTPQIMADDPIIKERQALWFESFAKSYQQALKGGYIDTMDDYIKFGQNLVGASPEIEQYMREQMKEHMPPKVKQQLAEMEAQQKEESDLMRRFSLYESINEKFKKDGRPYRLGLDGKTVQSNVDIEYQKSDSRRKDMLEMFKMVSKEVLDSNGAEKTNVPPETMKEYRMLRKALSNTILEQFANEMEKAGEGEPEPPAPEQPVKIQAPDGSVSMVPPNLVQKYVSRGGKIIQ